MLFLSSCGREDALDAKLGNVIKKHHLDADFQFDLESVSAKSDLIELGGALFFSPDLSLDGTVSCASCHHPKFAGADGVALPVGIGGVDSENVGINRIRAAKKSTKGRVREGLIPRNSPTVFNSSLYRSSMFWDGRTEYAASNSVKPVIKTGFGLSDYSPTPYQQDSLLQTQARMPISSFFEMKGWLLPNKNNHEIEQQVISFMQKQPLWCEKFKKVFDQNVSDCEKVLTLGAITEALAEYQASLVFTSSPFERYIRGDKKSLSQQQKKGALMFFTPIKKGGAGCFQCHSGKNLSDERFYNINIPASGRGANEHGWDFGRRNVDVKASKFSFKTRSLLNIAETAPYFHNGVSPTLESAILMHSKVGRKRAELDIIKLPNIDYLGINSAINSEFLSNDKVRMLLKDDYSDEEVQALKSFLHSLTDPCIVTEKCLAHFVHKVIESDRDEDILGEGENYPGKNNKKRLLNKASIEKPVFDCVKEKVRTVAKEKEIKGLFFEAKNRSLGIDHIRSVGLIKKGWLLDVVNYGGVSAQDLDYDCLDELVFDAGKNGTLVYKQKKSGGFEKLDIDFRAGAASITPLPMDIDGDYKYDLFLGNVGEEPASIMFNFINNFDAYYFLDLTGPVVNAAVGDVNSDGIMDLVFAFWRSFKSQHQPHIWAGDGHGNFVPHNSELVLRDSENNITNATDEMIRGKHQTPFSESDLTFTPNLADINGDGQADLLLASDFLRSQVLLNMNGVYKDVTNKNEIDDNNGMGAAIADFDNDGDLDWFVTSIYRGHGSTGTGNHLYINNGYGDFKKYSAFPSPSRPEWSWGACAADFNNDGLVDIFYVSGYGELLGSAKYESEEQKMASERFLLSHQERFAKSQPRLLLNNGNMKFSEVSSKVGLKSYFDGRGVSCFDYQQDGDIDIVVNPVEGAPIIFENKLSESANWISVRLVGDTGNTEAIGAKVILYSSSGRQYKEVRFQNNYMSRNPSQLHFGLGDMESIEKIEIHFPQGGFVKVLDQPKINTLHIVKAYE